MKHFEDMTNMIYILLKLKMQNILIQINNISDFCKTGYNIGDITLELLPKIVYTMQKLPKLKVI